MTSIGVGAIAAGKSYGVGTLDRIGPGLFPIALGALLAIVGVLIAGAAVASRREVEPGGSDDPQWGAWICIIAGPILFIVLGIYAGMIPAVFACVFVCSLGDDTATLKESLSLSAIMTILGVALFHYLLRVPLPLLYGFSS
jgi:uncharacterized membrane protein YhdT